MSQNKKKDKNDKKVSLTDYLNELREYKKALKKAKISKKINV